MALFDRNKRTGGFMDEIRCDEPSYLIWKWRPAGTRLGESKRENAIRFGSALRVKDGEAAVFVYDQKNGICQDYVEGPFDSILDTDNVPFLAELVGLAYGGGTPYQAEIYFINLAEIIQVKFGVPFFDVFDPRFSDFSVPVAVRGTISFKIDDVGAFVCLHRLRDFSLDEFQKQVRDAVSRYVKDIVANAPAAHNIPVIQIESKIAQINDAVEYDIAERLKDGFGVSVSGVDISAIEIDKASDGYRQLMSVTKDIMGATVKAAAEANIQNIADKQRIEAEHYEDTLRIQREEAQYAQHKQTQSTHFAAYQVEAQAEVGVAGANALGQMGTACTGSTGFDPAAMMAGMAVGGAVGQNIAGAMNNMMGGMNQQTVPGSVPPPIPVVAYHVAVNGQATGPYEVGTLQQMAVAGQFNANSLVWRTGMTEWVRASSVEELKGLFMPPIPSYASHSV